MTDVSIYIAVITAAAGVAGAAVSPVALAFKDGRQARRDRAERQATAVREARVNLLRATGELRTQVANARNYNGPEMGARLEDVRRLAADTQLYAASVAMLADSLATRAHLLATAAGKLADWTVENTNLTRGSLLLDPDFSELNTCTADFSKGAVAYARRPATTRVRGRRGGAQPRDTAATAEDQ